MQKRLTPEEYVERVAETNPNVEVVENYMGVDTKILHRCKICKYEWLVRPDSILRGSGCKFCSQKRIAQTLRKTHKQYVKELEEKTHSKIEVIEKYINDKTNILHRCKIDGYEWRVKPGNILTGYGCPICSGKKIGNSPNFTNSIWANLKMREKFCLYGMTENTMKTTMPHSNKRMDFICPNCGEQIKNKVINKVSEQGLSCPRCNDKISYPNKVIFNIMKQLSNKIQCKFEPEKVFKWSQNKRYDMYIEAFNKTIIVEMHGRQHFFPNGYKTARTLTEEQKNDKIKKENALQNGIDYYIIIDSSKSDIDFIKNNVMNSGLADILHFSEQDINWMECDIYAIHSRVCEVAELFNNGVTSQTLIAQKMKVNRHTIKRYFDIGKKIGLINNNACFTLTEIQKKEQKVKSCKKCILIYSNNDKRIFNAVKELAQFVNISYKHIHKYLKSHNLPSNNKFSDCEIWYLNHYLTDYHINEKDLILTI